MNQIHNEQTASHPALIRNVEGRGEGVRAHEVTKDVSLPEERIRSWSLAVFGHKLDQMTVVHICFQNVKQCLVTCSPFLRTGAISLMRFHKYLQEIYMSFCLCTYSHMCIQQRRFGKCIDNTFMD